MISEIYDDFIRTAMLTPTKKKYLLIMYELENKFNRIRSVDIANNLNVKKASVSNMLPSLIDEKFIERLPKGGIIFTAQGKKYSRELYEKYITLYEFLSKQLGSTEKNARDDAIACLCSMTDESIGNFTNFINKNKGNTVL